MTEAAEYSFKTWPAWRCNVLSRLEQTTEKVAYPHQTLSSTEGCFFGSPERDTKLIEDGSE